MKKIIFAVLISIICCAFFTGCGDGNIIAPVQKIVKPPIGISFREGFTGGVLQVHNQSSNRVMCHLSVFNDKDNNQRKVSFSVPPNEMKELGVLEIDWSFDPGEHGYITVDGYVGKINFKIYKNTYKVEWKALD